MQETYLPGRTALAHVTSTPRTAKSTHLFARGIRRELERLVAGWRVDKRAKRTSPFGCPAPIAAVECNSRTRASRGPYDAVTLTDFEEGQTLPLFGHRIIRYNIPPLKKKKNPNDNNNDRNSREIGIVCVRASASLCGICRSCETKVHF